LAENTENSLEKDGKTMYITDYHRNKGERQMKKNLFLFCFIAAIIILLNISCKSQAPAVIEEPVQQQPSPAPQVQEAAPPAPRDSGADLGRAEEARKKAGDFEGNFYFPGEWEAAEALFARGDYSKAADAFDSIFLLAIPLFAQAREDEIMAYRNSLIIGGARNSFPEFFPPADESALLAFSQYEQGDFYAAKDTAEETLLMFKVLAAAFDSWQIRQEINDRDFIFNDEDNFNRGGEILSDAMDAYKARNFPLAMETAEDALLRYNLVLAAGWEYFAETRAGLAEGERQAAIDSRTNIAARFIFNEAEANFISAQSLLESEKFEDAAKQFMDAEAMFFIANLTTSERRSHASAAIRQALENLERSDENARNAELIIEGGSN